MAFERSEISQIAFTDSTITRFDVLKSADTLAFTTVELGPTTEDDSGGDFQYPEAIGCLVWLATMTGPEIANAVRNIALYSHKRCERHWKAILQILFHLNAIRELGIHL